MAYDDRDYFRAEGGISFSGKTPPVTRALMIVLAVVHVAGVLVLAGTFSLLEAEYLAPVLAQPRGERWSHGAGIAYELFVLSPRHVCPWLEGFEPAFWKLLTHWVAAPSLWAALLEILGLWFAGRMVEEKLGSRPYLIGLLAVPVLAGLAACLADPLLAPESETVIVGPNGVFYAAVAPLVWLYPEARTFLGIRMRTFVIFLMGIGVGLPLFGAFSGAPFLASPTQSIFCALFAVGWALWLKKRGVIPETVSASGDVWSPPSLSVEMPRETREERKRREADDARRQREREEREKVDHVLEKISREGMHTLTRSEKKLLDAHSKRLSRKGE